MRTPTNALPTNVGLADLSGVGKIFYHLRYRFLPVEFADLCTLIEEIVLRDHILLIGKGATTPKHYVDAIEPLIRAQVFQFNLKSTPIGRIERPSISALNASHSAYVQGLTKSTITDADLEITRLLGAEADLKIPATVLLRNLHNFGVARRPRFEHVLCDLVERNKKLARDAQSLHGEILRYGPPARGFVNLNLPPLALAVFERAASFEKVIEMILDLRAALTDLRNETRALNEQLSDPATPFEDFDRLIQEWETRWRMSWNTALASPMYVANTSVALLIRSGLVVKSLCTGEWAGAFKDGAGVLKDIYNEAQLRALRPLHRPVANYLNSSRNQMREHVSRVFETDPDRVDIMMHRLAAPKSLWRQAFRGDG